MSPLDEDKHSTNNSSDPREHDKSRSPGSQTVMVSESLNPMTRKWTVDNFLIFRMGQGKGHKDWDCHGHKPTKVRLTRHQEDRGPVQAEQVLDHGVSRQGHQEVQEAGLTRVSNPSDQQVGIPDQSQD